MLFGVSAAFSPNFYVYIALRFLGGATVSGVVANVFVIGRYNVPSQQAHLCIHNNKAKLKWKKGSVSDQLSAANNSTHTHTPVMNLKFPAVASQVYIVISVIEISCMVLSTGHTHAKQNHKSRNYAFSLFSIFFKGGEWSDPSKFALCTIICHSSFPLGLMVMSGAAYLIQDWRILQLVLFCPIIIVLVIFYWSVATSITLYTYLPSLII